MKRLALLALVASCAHPTTSTGVEMAGEGRPAPVETSPAPTPAPILRATRTVPTRASRSRPATVDPTVAAGSHLDVTCYSYTGSRTASGKWPTVGMAASNSYPFGTRLQVEDVGVVTVEDRIGHGTDLDLFGPSEAYCRDFGRRHLLVRRVA